MSLVEITRATHDVRIELKYATKDNFTDKPIYVKGARCFLHPEAETCLRRAIALANAQGYRFLIFDAYRPPEAQWVLWNHTPDPNFLADPRRGSPHSRGTAIDLTLCRWDWSPLDMGTQFDEFSPKSHHGNQQIHAQAQRNRLILMGIMTTAGWDFYRNEWWHYQLFHSRQYPLISNEESGVRVMPT